MELFFDLYSISANHNLHCVDSDCVLSCEVYTVAHHTAGQLIQPTLPIPKADKIFNSLHLDQTNNVLVTIEDPLGSQTTHTLNEKLTQHYTLQTIKDNLLETKNDVFDELHDNIIDQNTENSISSFLNHSVHPPPFFLVGIEPLIKFSKKGPLAVSQFLEGFYWERGE